MLRNQKKRRLKRIRIRRKQLQLPSLPQEVFYNMAKRYNSTRTYMHQKYLNAKDLGFVEECLLEGEKVMKERNAQKTVRLTQAIKSYLTAVNPLHTVADNFVDEYEEGDTMYGVY